MFLIDNCALVVYKPPLASS